VSHLVTGCSVLMQLLLTCLVAVRKQQLTYACFAAFVMGGPLSLQIMWVASSWLAFCHVQ
jgi:hypothetical protein